MSGGVNNSNLNRELPINFESGAVGTGRPEPEITHEAPYNREELENKTTYQAIQLVAQRSGFTPPVKISLVEGRFPEGVPYDNGDKLKIEADWEVQFEDSSGKAGIIDFPQTIFTNKSDPQSASQLARSYGLLQKNLIEKPGNESLRPQIDAIKNNNQIVFKTELKALSNRDVTQLKIFSGQTDISNCLAASIKTNAASIDAFNEIRREYTASTKVKIPKEEQTTAKAINLEPPSDLRANQVKAQFENSSKESAKKRSKPLSKPQNVAQKGQSNTYSSPQLSASKQLPTKPKALNTQTENSIKADSPAAAEPSIAPINGLRLFPNVEAQSNLREDLPFDTSLPPADLPPNLPAELLFDASLPPNDLPPNLPPNLPEDLPFDTSLPPADLPPKLPEELLFDASLPPADLPPNLPEDLPFDTSLPPADLQPTDLPPNLPEELLFDGSLPPADLPPKLPEGYDEDVSKTDTSKNPSNATPAVEVIKSNVQEQAIDNKLAESPLADQFQEQIPNEELQGPLNAPGQQLTTPKALSTPSENPASADSPSEAEPNTAPPKSPRPLSKAEAQSNVAPSFLGEIQKGFKLKSQAEQKPLGEMKPAESDPALKKQLEKNREALGGSLDIQDDESDDWSTMIK